MELNGWMVLIVPLLTAVAGGSLAAVLTRKSNKESNVTNAFNMVVTQLLATNESLRKDAERYRGDAEEAETKYENAVAQIATLRLALAACEDSKKDCP